MGANRPDELSTLGGGDRFVHRLQSDSRRRRRCDERVRPAHRSHEGRGTVRGCAATRLLAARRLYISNELRGTAAQLPDGRRYIVFRDTSCDPCDSSTGITLGVWFHLRAIPRGASLRRWLFERACIVNTLLYAGFAGYRRKLWMVDPNTSDYAGLYSWTTAESAARYGEYITALIEPWCPAGSVGFEVRDVPFDVYLGR